MKQRRAAEGVHSDQAAGQLGKAVSRHQWRPMTAVDLFSGAGGFSLGLRRAGFDVVLANESSVDAEWTYRHNLLAKSPEAEFPPRPPETTTRARQAHRVEVRGKILADRLRFGEDLDCRMRGGDIRDALSDSWLRKWARRQEHEVDLLVAGPPCQGFSCAGKMCHGDDRNELVHEALRIIRLLRPRVAIIENVPGMLDRYADLVQRVGESLSEGNRTECGYYVCAELVHGEPLGVPQTRRRVLIVGVRQDLVEQEAHQRFLQLLFPVACPTVRPIEPTLFGMPATAGASLTATDVLGDLARTPPVYGEMSNWTHGYRKLQRSRTRKDLLLEVRSPRAIYFSGGLAELVRGPSTTEYYNHEASSHLPEIARRLSLLRLAASSSREAREHRCSSKWLREQFSEQFPELITKKASQRVLLPDQWPMLTVTSLPDDIVHYEEDRIPTVREVARLQTFPDWFEFMGVRTTGAERRRAGIYVPQYTQVANAVPPRLAHAVAARIRQFLILAEQDPTCRFVPEGGLYQTPNLKGTASGRLRDLNNAFRQAALKQSFRLTAGSVGRRPLLAGRAAR